MAFAGPAAAEGAAALHIELHGFVRRHSATEGQSVFLCPQSPMQRTALRYLNQAVGPVPRSESLVVVANRVGREL